MEHTYMKHTYTRSVQNRVAHLSEANLNDDFSHDWDEDASELKKLANEFGRPFSEGLDTLLTHTSYDGAPHDIQEKVTFICAKMAVAGILVDASRKKTLKNWFLDLSCPGQQSRTQLYELCFALSLSLEDTRWFFHNVLFQRDFNCHLPEEAVYYYCFLNRYDYRHAQGLLSDICSFFEDTRAAQKSPACEKKDSVRKNTFCRNGDATGERPAYERELYTVEIAWQLEHCSTDEELRQYFRNNKHLFSGNHLNSQAKKHIQKMLADIRGNAVDKEILRDLNENNGSYASLPCKAGCSLVMRELLQSCADYEDLKSYTKHHDISSISFMLECIYGICLSAKKIPLPQRVRKNFPSEKVFSDLLNNFDSSTNYDAIRKCLILLKFYHFWATNQFQVTEMPETLYRAYQAETNDLLTECGYDKLFAGNHYDRLFLLCSGSGTPLETLRCFLAA